MLELEALQPVGEIKGIDYSWSGNNLSALARVHDIPTLNFSLFFL
jgi:hypothetical protein